MEASIQMTDQIFVVATNIWKSKVTAVKVLTSKLLNTMCNALIHRAIWKSAVFFFFFFF